MFEVLHSDKKIVKFLLPLFLGLILLPFVVTGVVDFDTSNRKEAGVAKVGRAVITTPRFDEALKQEQEQMRRALGDAFKSSMANSLLFRQEVLNNLIERQLLLQEADRRKLWLSDDVVRHAIAADPIFQENGVFSKARYDWYLREAGLQFEVERREVQRLRQYVDVLGSAFASTAQAEALLRLRLEERQFREARIPAAQFFGSVAVPEGDIQKYYDANAPLFREPEKIKVEYVVLSQDDLFSRVTPTESEIKAWYEGHQKRYRQEEERQARHILIKAQNAEEKAKVKSKAEQVLSEVKKTPARFGELARRHSEDIGSAQGGGDLGFFQRGTMVKPFEDAVFETLKKEEVSGLVETEHGYHIIQLMDIRPERTRSLSEVRGEIEDEVRRQAAARKFAESAESFSNAVYDQFDALRPIAENFGLALQQTDWLLKNQASLEAQGLNMLADDRVFRRIFSEDAIKTRQNIEAMEVGPNVFLAARVVAHEPAKLKPLETVKKQIEEELRLREAMKLAQKAGKDALEKLEKNGEVRLTWSPVKKVARDKAAGEFPEAMVKAIFRADSGKLPAYGGLADKEGYTLFSVIRVQSPEKTDDQAVRAVLQDYNATVTHYELSAFMSHLRKRYPVEINASKLVAPENN